MLTITIRIKTLGYEDVNSTDISRKLSTLGHAAWQRSTLLLEYQSQEHEEVFHLLNAADDWVQAVTLEEVEANYGHGMVSYVGGYEADRRVVPLSRARRRPVLNRNCFALTPERKSE